MKDHRIIVIGLLFVLAMMTATFAGCIGGDPNQEFITAVRGSGPEFVDLMNTIADDASAINCVALSQDGNELMEMSAKYESQIGGINPSDPRLVEAKAEYLAAMSDLNGGGQSMISACDSYSSGNMLAIMAHLTEANRSMEAATQHIGNCGDLIRAYEVKPGT